MVCLFLCPHGLRVRGTYSTEEFFVFLAKFGFDACCGEDIVDLFNLIDVNGDQTISKEEFIGFIYIINAVIQSNGGKKMNKDLSILKESLK